MRFRLPIIIAGLLLAGFGCTTPAANINVNNGNANVPANVNRNGNANVNVPVNGNANGNVNTNINSNTNGNTNTNRPSGDIRDLPAATAVDSTWGTYTNDALDFTFQYPTRGSYAPTWETSFVNESDSKIQGGCYVTPQNESRAADRFRVSGVEFCRTFASEGAAGSVFLTQNVVTKKGTRYILMSFTKKVTNADMIPCSPRPESGLSLNSTVCVPFITSEFDAQVEQIVSTFRYT